MKAVINIFILILFSLYSCTAQKEGMATELTGKSWNLIELSGTEITADTSLTANPHFILNKDDSTFTGFGICNTFSGSFKLSDSSLKFSEVAVTEIACRESNLEHQILEMLNEVSSYTVEEDTLIFYNDKSILARFSSN